VQIDVANLGARLGGFDVQEHANASGE
jgi:hypothetical protein